MVSAITGNVAVKVAASSAKPAGPRFNARELSALDGLDRKLPTDDPAQLRETASKLLSQLFFSPLLAEMRKLPFGERFANGGRTEEIFGEQLDMRLADAVGQAGAGGVTDQIAKRLAAAAYGGGR